MKGPTPSRKNDSTGPDTDHTLQTAGAFSVDLNMYRKHCGASRLKSVLGLPLVDVKSLQVSVFHCVGHRTRLRRLKFSVGRFLS